MTNTELANKVRLLNTNDTHFLVGWIAGQLTNHDAEQPLADVIRQCLEALEDQ